MQEDPREWLSESDSQDGSVVLGAPGFLPGESHRPRTWQAAVMGSQRVGRAERLTHTNQISQNWDEARRGHCPLRTAAELFRV